MVDELKKRHADLKVEGLSIVPEDNRWLWLKMTEDMERDQKGLMFLHLFNILNIVKCLEAGMDIGSVVDIIKTPELSEYYTNIQQSIALLSSRGAELICALDSNKTLEEASEWIDFLKQAKKEEDPSLN